jgi:DNA-binding transcriptional LysR family regulator
MSTLHFSALDLNLLRVFDALIEERSVTRAGARLGLTQSAVSHALGRLRDILDDELFRRGPEGMLPTPRALEIGPRLRQGLLQLQRALTPGEFVPEESERRFTIAADEYTSAVLLPGVMARVRQAAPRVELRIRHCHIGIVDEMEAGRLDLAIANFRRVPERFHCDVLFQDSVVWALRADHPFAQGELTLDRLAQLPHLVLGAAGENIHPVDGFISESGLERRVACDDGILQAAFAARGLRRIVGITIPHPLAALPIVKHSDMAALLPRRPTARVAGHFGLKLFAPPYSCKPFDVMALWREGQGDQPAVLWLRSVLREAAAEL